MTTSQYFGGSVQGGSAVSGLFSLEKVHDELLSREKAILLRNLLADVAGVLETKVSNVQNMPLDQVVAELKRLVPDPTKNRFVKDKGVHKKLCKKLAEAFNKRYGRVVIDTSATNAEICENTATVLYSLASGIKTEFLTLYTDVKRVLTNMAVLKNSIESSFNKVMDIINEQNIPGAAIQADAVKTLYSGLIQELDRQMVVLGQLLDTKVDETSKTIAELDVADEKYRGMVQSLKGDIGTTDFSRKIAYLLAGVNTVAIMAEAVDKALRQAGLSLEDYKKPFKNTGELINHLYDVWQGKNKDPSADKLAEFIAALEIVRNYDYAHNDIVSYLQDRKSKVGRDHQVGGAVAERSLEKRMQRQTKTREVLLADFENRIEQQQRIIMKTVEALSKVIGETIPMDDNLSQFIKSFKDLGSNDAFSRENYHIALSGVRDDPVSKSERAHFLGLLETVVHSLEPLKSGPSGHHFRELQAAFNRLTEIIDKFRDTYLKPLSKIAIDTQPGIALDTKTMTYGGSVDPESDFAVFIDTDDSPVDGGAGQLDKYVTLNQASRHLQFYFNAARTRIALKAAADEVQGYNTTYEVILGDTIGNLVVSEKKAFDSWKTDVTKQLDGTKTDGYVYTWVNSVPTGAMVDPVNTGTMTADNAKKVRKEAVENAVKFAEEQLTAKIDFLKTIEAIDLYLLHFTDAISKNPDDVQEIKRILESVEIAAKWFTEKSGDSIAQFYESMPIVTGSDDTKFVKPNLHVPEGKDFAGGDTHYYEWVKTLSGNSMFPSSPFNMLYGFSVDDTNYLQKTLDRAQKAITGVRALDNIISCFHHIGNKFGNLVPSEKTFMSPGVILKNLRKYLFYSSLTRDLKGNRLGDMNKISDKFDTKPLTFHGKTYNIDGSNIAGSIEAKVGFVLTPPGIDSEWKTTDELFTMAIKSMMAKILTVIGTYGIFNKPLDKYTGVSPVRMILGGGSDIPEVIPEAIELYIRLTLLAEFYREIFSTKTPVKEGEIVTDDSKKILIVPDFEGVWSNFLKVIFEDAKHVTHGAYSEEQVRKIVTEINGIYRRYKAQDSKTTIMTCINSLVSEINRRYGVVKYKEIEKYLREKEKYDETEYKSGDNLEYNLLDEKTATGRRAAPSDRFDTGITVTERKAEIPWNIKIKEMVYDFRDKMDKEIKGLSKEAKTTSFDDTIRQYKLQVHNAKNNEEKYNIVLKSLQGVDQLNRVNNHKAVMFHELVISPLSTLQTIWGIVHKFTQNIQEVNLVKIEEDLNKAESSIMGSNDNPLDGHASGAKSVVYSAIEAALGENKKYIHPGFKPDTVKQRLDHTLIKNVSNPGARNNIVVYHGTYGAGYVRSGTTVVNRYPDLYNHVHRTGSVYWGDIDRMVLSANDSDKKVAFEGIKRFGIDREGLFKDYVNTLFTFGIDMNDLVKISVHTGNLVLDTTLLKERIIALLDRVKKNLNMFRGVIDDSIIRMFEGRSNVDKTVSGDINRNVGSVYWIEEQLVERYLKGKRDSKMSNYKLLSLANTSELVSAIFKRFRHKWSIIGGLTKVDGSYNGTDSYGHHGVYIFRKPVPQGDSEIDKELSRREHEFLQDSFDVPMAQLSFWDMFNRGGKHSVVGTDRELPDFNQWLYQVIPTTNNMTMYDDTEFKKFNEIVKMMKETHMEICKIINTSVTSRIKVEATGPPSVDIVIYKNKILDLLTRDPLSLPIMIPFDAPSPVNMYYVDYAPGEFYWVQGGDFIAFAESINKAPFNTGWTSRNTVGASPYYHVRGNKQITAKWGSVGVNVWARENYPFITDKSLQSQYKQAANTFNSLKRKLDHIREAYFKTPINPGRYKVFSNPDNAAEADSWNYRNQSDFEPGLLLQLNEILSRYLYSGWDTSSKKMYVGLINRFANASHSQAVFKGLALNDIDQLGYQYGLPQKHVTVLASLARFMRNILVVTKKSGDHEFKTDSLMDVPLYIKETLKGNLPIFDKLIKLVIKKTDLLKQISKEVSLVRQVPYKQKYGVVSNTGSVPRHKGAPMLNNLKWTNNLHYPYPYSTNIKPSDAVEVLSGTVLYGMSKHVKGGIKYERGYDKYSLKSDHVDPIDSGSSDSPKPTDRLTLDAKKFEKYGIPAGIVDTDTFITFEHYDDNLESVIALKNKAFDYIKSLRNYIKAYYENTLDKKVLSDLHDEMNDCYNYISNISPKKGDAFGSMINSIHLSLDTLFDYVIRVIAPGLAPSAPSAPSAPATPIPSAPPAPAPAPGPTPEAKRPRLDYKDTIEFWNPGSVVYDDIGTSLSKVVDNLISLYPSLEDDKKTISALIGDKAVPLPDDIEKINDILEKNITDQQILDTVQLYLDFVSRRTYSAQEFTVLMAFTRSISDILTQDIMKNYDTIYTSEKNDLVKMNQSLIVQDIPKELSDLKTKSNRSIITNKESLVASLDDMLSKYGLITTTIQTIENDNAAKLQFIAFSNLLSYIHKYYQFMIDRINKFLDGTLVYGAGKSGGAVGDSDDTEDTDEVDESDGVVPAAGSYYVGSDSGNVHINTRLPAYQWQEEPYLYTKNEPIMDLDMRHALEWYNSLFDDITSMAVNIQKCISDTYKELGDEPKFFETSESSIIDYQNLNKKLPVMLLSQLQIALRNRFGNYDPKEVSTGSDYYARGGFMSPFYKSGEQPFKLLYGSRLILNRPEVKPTLEYMPGMTDLLDKYNGVSSGHTRIDKSEFEAFVIDHMSLLRYAIDIRHYKEPLIAIRDSPAMKLVDSRYDNAQYSGSTMVVWPIESRSYAFRKTLDTIVGLTESSSQDQNVQDLVSTVIKGRTLIDSRQNARIFNIIDMNIVPVNVHALRRELPLINVINYSYTCDRMIQEHLLGGLTKVDDYSLITADHKCKTPTEFMCKILVHPHCKVTSEEYFTFMQMIMTGYSNLDLGRPKFLGDQIWNKVLLRSLYEQTGSALRIPGPVAPSYQIEFLKDGSAEGKRISELTYMKTDDKGEVKLTKVAVDDDYTKRIVQLGFQRFNTTFMRNVVFIVQMQRLLRMLMRDEISYFETPVVSSLDAVSRHITEYVSNEKYESSAFNE